MEQRRVVRESCGQGAAQDRSDIGVRGEIDLVFDPLLAGGSGPRRFADGSAENLRQDSGDEALYLGLFAGLLCLRRADYV